VSTPSPPWVSSCNTPLRFFGSLDSDLDTPLSSVFGSVYICDPWPHHTDTHFYPLLSLTIFRLSRPVPRNRSGPFRCCEDLHTKKDSLRAFWTPPQTTAERKKSQPRRRRLLRLSINTPPTPSPTQVIASPCITLSISFSFFFLRFFLDRFYSQHGMDFPTPAATLFSDLFLSIYQLSIIYLSNLHLRNLPS